MKPATAEISRPDAEVWITKEAAAKYLTVRRNGRKPEPISPRRILEYTQAGALRSALQRGKSGQQEVMVLLADVLRLQQERENPPALPAVPREPKQKLLGPPASAALSAAPVPHSRAWLTLDESSEYTGLPPAFLQSLVDAGTLPALNVGVRPGGRWRIKRADLDAIQGVSQ